MLRGLALSAGVRAALKSDPRTEGVDITIECSGAAARLTGIVLNATERAAARSRAGSPASGPCWRTASDGPRRACSRPPRA